MNLFKLSLNLMLVTLRGRFTINVDHDIQELVTLNTIYHVSEGWCDYIRVLWVQETWSSKHLCLLLFSFFFCFLSFGANDYFLAISTNQNIFLCKLIVTCSMLTMKMFATHGVVATCKWRLSSKVVGLVGQGQRTL